MGKLVFPKAMWPEYPGFTLTSARNRLRALALEAGVANSETLGFKFLRRGRTTHLLASGSTIEEVLGLSEDETKTALEAFPTVAMLDKEKVISQWRERQGESKNKQILESS